MILWLLVVMALAGDKADAKDCKVARSGETRGHWEVYLRAHPDGACVAEAKVKMQALALGDAAPAPAPEVVPEAIGGDLVEVAWATVVVEVGPLAQEAVIAGLDAAEPGLRECGLRELARNPAISAMNDAVTVMIGPDGAPTAVAWKNGAWPEEVRECAEKALLRAVWPAGEGATTFGGTLTIVPH